MKRKLPVFLEALVLSMVAAWGAVGCLTSAFSISVGNPPEMVLLWLAWALVCAGLMQHRWGVAAVLALGAAGAAWLLLDGRFGPQLLSFLGALAECYDGAYGWGVPQFLLVEQLAADLPMTVLGFLLIFAVSLAVCRRRGTGLAVLLHLVLLGS